MNTYSIIAFYESSGQVFSENIQGESPIQALRRFSGEWGGNPDDLIIVDLLEVRENYSEQVYITQSVASLSALLAL